MTMSKKVSSIYFLVTVFVALFGLTCSSREEGRTFVQVNNTSQVVQTTGHSRQENLKLNEKIIGDGDDDDDDNNDDDDDDDDDDDESYAQNTTVVSSYGSKLHGLMRLSKTTDDEDEDDDDDETPAVNKTDEKAFAFSDKLLRLMEVRTFLKTNARLSQKAMKGRPAPAVCPEGFHAVKNNVTECKPCETGTYNGETGQSSCKKCDKGTYNPLTGQSNKTSCKVCQNGHFTEEPGRAECHICPLGKRTPHGDQTRCIDAYLADALKQLENMLALQKEKQNDLSIKNSRLWQKETIRMLHDKMMAQRKERDNRKEQNACEAERRGGTIIFPAIEVENEIEGIEDTTCIDTNRDEMLKSFCSFRSDLDNLFHIQNIKKEAKTFWPNICCKERRDTTLEVCNDPSGKRQRGEIVPFALSSGGNSSPHSLYVEVTETLNKGG
jgi:hypothetical protein